MAEVSPSLFGLVLPFPLVFASPPSGTGGCRGGHQRGRVLAFTPTPRVRFFSLLLQPLFSTTRRPLTFPQLVSLFRTPSIQPGGQRFSPVFLFTPLPIFLLYARFFPSFVLFLPPSSSPTFTLLFFLLYLFFTPCASSFEPCASCFSYRHPQPA